MAIAVTMCKLFAALILGFVLNKMDILDERTSKRLSSMIMTFIMPFLIISSVAGMEGDGGEVLKLFAAGAVWYLLLPLIAFCVVRVPGIPVNLRGTYMCMVMFSNNAFMGYPVVSALFGDSAIFYATIFNLLFNLLVFSLGIFLIRRDAGAKEAVEEKKAVPKSRLSAVRQVLNNGVIASILALIIYFSGFRLPAVVSETCSFIGNICMPLSMMVVGSSIAGYSFRDIFSVKRVYFITAVRLILLPLLAYFALNLVWDNTELIKIAVITVGMPIASVVAMAAAPYEEQGREAAIAVVFTTLCSMVTIPIMLYLIS